MNARLKLNTATINGAVIINAVVGWAFGSWMVFFVTAAALIIAAIYAGDIRTQPRPPRNRPKR